jgi:hypothetical protein
VENSNKTVEGGAARAFMAMPCLAATETVSEWKKSNQKEFTSPKGSILWMFSLSEPPMWDGKYGNRHGNTEGLIIARLQPNELSKY